MKKLIKYIVPLFLFFIITPVKAQVLFNETFDNYALGDFYSGTGNWHLNGSVAKILQEPNKGNVLVASVSNQGILTVLQNVSQIWGNRAVGNNVLLVEYDVYKEDFLNNSNVDQHNSELEISGVGGHLFRILFRRGYYPGSSLAESNVEVIFANNGFSRNYNNINFTKSWFTVKLYIDYNTNKKYVHIPTLNIVGEYSMGTTISVLNRILFGSRVIATNATGYTGIIAKYDNIRVTALKTIPQELIDAILSTDNFLADKFNLYPNPATNVVNITNSENMVVQQVTVYDISGKQLNTQSFNYETQIQLNVENLASGTYMLHIQTNEGLAVKKLVKK